MKIITEIELREAFKKQPFDSYVLYDGHRLTPAAHQFLTERRIKILDSNGKITAEDRNNNPKNSGYPAQKEKTGAKPEEYTHLHGNALVLKNHKRIRFRGKLDSVQADIIAAIAEIKESNENKLCKDLTEILDSMRMIMRAEVMDEPLQEITFNGWNCEEIRERSHHPKKYFGVAHFNPDPGQGKTMALLNRLRTHIRELEIMAVDAFLSDKENSVERPDIVQTLNRLSSAAYIIMCRYLGGNYNGS